MKINNQILKLAMIIFAVAGLLVFAQPQKNEIAQIKDTSNLDQQVKLYTQLIERVGPIQAQEDLYHSGLPFTGQTHLLNHTVGDYLYQKFGAEALSQCREYFLASCYHGFVLDAIAIGGIPEVSKIMQNCKSDPAVYPQCAHAVGHGFLAHAGYKNLIKALEKCDQMPNSVPGFPLFNCYDGIFMENIWGVHEDGQPSKDRWVKDSDPFYPCNDNRIDQKYLLGCWSNQPALAYQQFRGDISKVSDVCDSVLDKAFQDMCFNGLSRQIHPITNGSVEATFDLCGKISKDRIDYCVNIVAQSAFGVGDRTVPFQICQRQTDSGKHNCYQNLIGQIKAYAKSASDIDTWCGRIEDLSWRSKCEN